MTIDSQRVAVLWEHLAGYTQAALRAVIARRGTEVVVVQRSRECNATFARALDGAREVIDLSESGGDSVDLVDRIRDFDPEVTLVTNSADPRYQAVAQANRREGRVTVWGSDVPSRSWWRDSRAIVRGRLGALRSYDAAFVPGAAGSTYARRVGFSRGRIFQGLYTCDAELYRPVGIARHTSKATQAWPRVFLFVGQFIPRKGLDTLLAAYQKYRVSTTDPWALWCVGAGPLRDQLRGQRGVEVMDFAPPDECARLMSRSGALILPSRIDHWGVVIHEAACAGLPVIVSQTSYAAADLVEEGSSGYTFHAGDVEHLARLMTTCADEAHARALGAQSLALSYRFDPSIFAARLCDDIPRALSR